MTGIVIKSTGSWFSVKAENNNIIECRIKGKFRMKGLKSTNPLAVGDKVDFDFHETENIGLITKIYERKNYIIRKSTNLSKLVHIIAANIDQAYIIITVAEPRTSTGFIDRFLITAEAYNIPANIIFNKIDIYNSELEKLHNRFIKTYTDIGYKCYEVSAKRGDNLDILKSSLENKINLFAGHSGVGKSAIINRLIPDLNIKVKEISSVHLKGTHTTTFAEMHELKDGGFIIDTPGIKEFGVIDFRKEELFHYFPEIFKISKDCQFNNCTHTHEPNCAVKKALKEGRISESRYKNYINIFLDKDLELNEWELR
ncbi:MAG: ribosome small subunit-dependent GTPase A [Saprospiraceae bacterium]|nr:ribosome small subunit-dependent GTPase A [Saprospiraceae bacterium]